MEKFNYEPNGYNRKEVNQFISDVIDQTSGIVKKYTEQKEKIKQQEAEISKLREEVEHYHRIESNLKDTIIRAEHTANHIKYLAEQDSDIIVKDAKNSASRIVNEALIKAEKIDNQTDIANKNLKIFKRKLKILLEQQAAIIDEIEDIEILD